MKKILAVLLLAVTLTGCHPRLVPDNLPAPIEVSPVQKFRIVGTPISVTYFKSYEDDEKYREEYTEVCMRLDNGKAVWIAFPHAVVDVPLGKHVTLIFTGSYGRATFVSVE